MALSKFLKRRGCLQVVVILVLLFDSLLTRTQLRDFAVAEALSVLFSVIFSICALTVRGWPAGATSAPTGFAGKRWAQTQ